MLKTLFSVFIAPVFLLPFTATAQVVCMLGSVNANPPYNAYSDQRPTGDAMQLAGQVNAGLVSACRPNCPTVAMFRNATATNAMMIAAGGQAKIVYKPEFFTVVYETYGDAGILAILAHEVGHAIDRSAPASWMKSGWTPELRADAWAGCALARIDLSLNALRSALIAVSKYPSPSHPSWTLRVPALRLGYTHCGGDGAKFDRTNAG